MAVIAIMKTPEVIAFRREHNVGPEADWGPGISYPSDAFAVDKPSVHGEFYEITVRKALDYVLRTFPGFWVYENCQDRGLGRRVVMGFIENVPDSILSQTQK